MPAASLDAVSAVGWTLLKSQEGAAHDASLDWSFEAGPFSKAA
jgi:hypothetical protein